mmetsp:Transcript_2683/g.5987  ORF Transcript_2683/g.5987 Transcript_2683/m.5987 type:complete len:189 (-) Transcript_2683:1414-1980(-)
MVEKRIQVDEFLTLVWTITDGISEFIVLNESDNFIEFTLSLLPLDDHLDEVRFVKTLSPLVATPIGTAEFADLEACTPVYSANYRTDKTVVPHKLNEEVDLVITTQFDKELVTFELLNHSEGDLEASFIFTLLHNITLLTTPHQYFELKAGRPVFLADAKTSGVYRYEYRYQIGALVPHDSQVEELAI